jgi:hypothetical protein
VAATNTSTAAVAGWSSPAARQPHKLEVAGSNPAPVTTLVDRQLAQLRALIEERDALVRDLLQMQVIHMRVLRARVA